MAIDTHTRGGNKGSQQSGRPCRWRIGLLVIAMLTPLFFALPGPTAQAAGPTTFFATNISPETMDPDAPANRNGIAGRVNGLGVSPRSREIAYAASEWGGLYKTTNGGDKWFRLNGHQPQAT